MSGSHMMLLGSGGSGGFNLTAATIPSGGDANEVGFCRSPVSVYYGIVGTTDPTPVEYKGATVLMVSASHTYASGFVRVWMSGARAVDFFTYIIVNGVLLASADYSSNYQDIGCTTWTWTGVPDTGLRNGGTYPISFV